MKQDRNITISNTHGLTTRTTVGHPKKRATKERPPVTFGPTHDRRGPQGPGAEARALMEHHRDRAQETISTAIANGASVNDALRMARNFLLAGRRADTQYRAELEGSPAVQTI
jgi:hypothetical protein